MSKKKIATEAAVTESYTVFYMGEAEKISPHSKGLLTYELGKEGETGSLALRLTANGEGGLFSREWIALDAIHATSGNSSQTAFHPCISPTVWSGQHQ